MRRRSPARFLAPVALVTCAVAVYAVVHQETSSKGQGSSSSTSTTAGRRTTTSVRQNSTGKARTTYTVKSGDVLSAIAIKTGTTVAELQRLNPKMDAATLHPGQKLKLP
jgi:LysM repeat protein